jgi:hypothetical protein
MSIQLIGGSAGDVPFNRTFFNVTLGDMVSQNGKEKAVKLTLYLSDGATLDVCSIDELTDSYVAARAYQANNDSCELTVQLIPYGLIYRIEISPKVENNDRVGFHFKSSGRKVTTRRSR